MPIVVAFVAGVSTGTCGTQGTRGGWPTGSGTCDWESNAWDFSDRFLTARRDALVLEMAQDIVQRQLESVWRRLAARAGSLGSVREARGYIRAVPYPLCVAVFAELLTPVSKYRQRCATGLSTGPWSWWSVSFQPRWSAILLHGRLLAAWRKRCCALQDLGHRTPQLEHPVRGLRACGDCELTLRAIESDFVRDPLP